MLPVRSGTWLRTRWANGGRAEQSRGGISTPVLAPAPPHRRGIAEACGNRFTGEKSREANPRCFQTKLDEKELFARCGRDLGRSLLDVL